MTSERFALKARERRRRTLRRVAIAVLAVAVAAGGVWAVAFSSLLEAREVTVSGVQHVPEQRVLRAAEVPLGTPLPRLDTDAIAARVTELLAVKSARIERDLPHTVRIVVTERAAAAWVDRSGTPWAVDASGVVYRPLNSEPSHLPQLMVDAQDSRLVSATAGVAAELADSEADLLGDTRAIRARTRDSIELDLSNGRTIVWGSADDAAAKLAVLGPLLKIEASSYDVSAPERPTTRQ